MTYTYKIEMSFDVGKTESGDFIGRINDFMGTCGFTEKMMVRGHGFTMELTSGRILKLDEVEEIKKLILESFNDKLDWGWEIEAFYLGVRHE